MNYKELIPKDTFIYEYLDFCDNLETSKDFDFWSAVFILSTLCKNSIYVNRPNSRIYLNFYLSFLSNMNYSKKYISIDLVKETLSRLLKVGEVIYMDKYITENHFKNIVKHVTETTDGCSVCICSDDYASMIKGKMMYGYLNDLFLPKFERINNGDLLVFRNFINCISSNTLDNYFKIINKIGSETNFINKHIIIYDDKPKRKIGWSDNEKSFKNICTEGKRIKKFIQKFEPTISLSTKAIQRYCGWYDRRVIEDNSIIAEYQSYEPDYILKLAGILCINAYKTVIDETDISNAIIILKNVKKNLSNVINLELTKSVNDELEKNINRIIKALTVNKVNGIKHKDLFAKVHTTMSIEDFNYVINVLHELGCIDKLQPKNRVGIIYKLSKNITKLNINYLLKQFN